MIRSSKNLTFFSQRESATSWSKDSPLAEGTHLDASFGKVSIISGIIGINMVKAMLITWKHLVAHLNSSFRVAFVRGQFASRRSWRTLKDHHKKKENGCHLLGPTFSSIVSSCASIVCSLFLQIGSVPQQKLHMSDVTMRATSPRSKVHGRFSPEKDKSRQTWGSVNQKCKQHFQSTWSSSIRLTDPVV